MKVLPERDSEISLSEAFMVCFIIGIFVLLGYGIGSAFGVCK